ncbi:hypothetical protein T02_1724 [Trichinella nativa]|uniref:Uncharacterized protein n=1 Tax=Trichinella nativa TaxID=6335 RepID=A0A0V1KQP0_9BILA|nr:hypothetical protein T02_1724 [Trichinella nativa]
MFHHDDYKWHLNIWKMSTYALNLFNFLQASCDYKKALSNRSIHFVAYRVFFSFHESLCYFWQALIDAQSYKLLLDVPVHLKSQQHISRLLITYFTKNKFDGDSID